jgi:nitroreductase
LLDALQATCADFRPFDDCRVELIRAPELDIFRGIIGSYGKVVGAPHVLVMIAEAERPSAQQHIGYTGEGCVLEATALGLDTCWVGGFFSHRKVGRLLNLSDAESVLAVSPVGHAVVGLSRNERIMRRMAHSHGRKPIGEIAEALDGAWPTWARSAVECARIAPSAVNRQPWRFRMQDGRLYISKTHGELPSVTKALDCGIAMLHAELGALAQGVTGKWSDCTEGHDVAAFEPNSKGVD